jgi:beta-carotene 15,15'-dioxygenase
MAKYSHIPLEFYVLIVTLLLAGIHLLFPLWIEVAAPYLLLAGIIFPGIPHGAIDHHLEVSDKRNKYYLPLFVVKYILIMALIAAIWFMLPLLGLSLFIIYSAWHFGETDMRRLQSFHPLFAFLYGISLLVFILSSHSGEFSNYVSLFGIPAFQSVSSTTYLIVSLLSLASLIVIGVVGVKNKTRYFSLVVIILLGSLLPLLLAFGIYFILIHSISGWTHIRKGLKVSHSKLLFRALPFSMGAFVMMGTFITISNLDNVFIDKYISSFFIALAAISAPHILYMSKFYKSRL